MKSLIIKNIIYLGCFLFFFLGYLQLPAQVKDKADDYKKKASRKTERRVDREVDDVIDAGLDKIFKKKKKDKTKPPKDDELMADPSLYETEEEDNIALANAHDISENKFIGSFQLNVERMENGQIDRSNSKNETYHFIRYQSAFQADPNAYSIYHLQEKTLAKVKVTNGAKEAAIISKPASPKWDFNAADYEATRLSSSKIFEGQKCFKYVINAPDDYITLWIAESIPCDFELLMRSVDNFSRNKWEKVNTSYGIYGLPMEITVESKVKDSSITMKLSNLQLNDPDPSIFDLSNAKVTRF